MPTVDELTENTVMKNMRKLAQGVDNNFNDIQTSVDNAVETANNAMEATEGFDDRITDNATAIENEVTARQNADEAETEARTKADITGIETAISSGAISVTLNRPLGALSDSVTGPFIKTATLIPSATDRAFKLQFQYWDDTTYTTNDFVIPEGGGTDVSVSGVTVSEGDNANEFKVSIQLDDATTIDSNSYPFPESVTNPYPVSISGTLSGTTLNLTIGLNNSTNVTGTADLSAFLTKSEASTTYATKTEVTEIDTKVDAIGVTSEGNNVSVNGKTATIVKSVSGQVTDGNLKITVNGVESGDIPLPDSVRVYTQNPYHFNSNRETFSHRKENCIICNKISDTKGNFYSVGNINTSAELSKQYYYEGRTTQDLYWASINTTDIENIFKHIIPDYASLEDGEYRISMYAMLPDSNTLYAMAGYGDVVIHKSGTNITSGVGSSHIFTELETITTDAIVIITAMDKVS